MCPSQYLFGQDAFPGRPEVGKLPVRIGSIPFPLSPKRVMEQPISHGQLEPPGAGDVASGLRS